METAIRWAVRATTAAAAIVLLFVAGAQARTPTPCCTITAINASTAVITGRVNSDGQTFTFGLQNRSQIAALKVGQPIYANLSSKQVSLDGKAASGTILSISAPPSSAATKPSGTAAPAAAPPPGAPVARVLAPSVAPYLAHDVRILGVYSPATENLNNEPDPVPSGIPVTHKVALSAAAVNLAETKHLLSTNEGKQAIQQAAQKLGGIQMHLALLAGHKYMVADCLGVKASAGNFDVSIPGPQISFGTTSVTVKFTVSHVALNVLTIRLRPDLTDAIHPCHFSARVGIGGSADNLTYSMTLDPLYNIQSCKLSNMNVLSTEWSIGSFTVSPLPSQVTGNAKDMVVDALNYFTGFGVGDVFTQNIEDLLTQSVCKALP